MRAAELAGVGYRSLVGPPLQDEVLDEEADTEELSFRVDLPLLIKTAGVVVCLNGCIAREVTRRFT